MSKEIIACFEQLKQAKTTSDFKRLYQLSSVKLSGVILHIVKCDDLAQDCLQEVYVKIWHKVDTYDKSKANPLTWMKNIAKNHAIDIWRQRHGSEANIEILDNLSNETNILDELETTQQHQALHICLNKLQPKISQILHFIYFYGLSYEQVAQRMSIPIGTVKSRISRSMLSLKQCLQSL